MRVTRRRPSVGRRRPQPEACRHRHKVRKRVGLHLAHDLASVCLHGDLADAEFSADLLIQQTRDDTSMEREAIADTTVYGTRVTVLVPIVVMLTSFVGRR
jgi:hypothetical protein